ncbi:MAG: SseB family protein, partial [Lentisphaeria bacterium]
MRKLLNAFFKGKSKEQPVQLEEEVVKVEKKVKEKEIDIASIPPFLRAPGLGSVTTKALDNPLLVSKEIQKLEPENKIEQALQKLHAKELSIREFIDYNFWSTEFFVLTNEKPQVDEKGEITNMPQLLTIGINNQPHACLFTSLERAKVINAQAGHSCAIQVNAQALVDLFKGRCGIVINYGWDLTVAFDQEFNGKLYEAMQKHFSERNASELVFRSEKLAGLMSQEEAI